MNIYNEVLLLNPITEQSIEKLFREIKSCESPFLIIDVGQHNFESILVLKLFKEKFIHESETLNRFEKIAFIHPPEYKNISENEEKYNYFINREEALDWFSE